MFCNVAVAEMLKFSERLMFAFRTLQIKIFFLNNVILIYFKKVIKYLKFKKYIS